jgi:hypothetical protein
MKLIKKFIIDFLKLLPEGICTEGPNRGVPLRCPVHLSLETEAISET